MLCFAHLYVAYLSISWLPNALSWISHMIWFVHSKKLFCSNSKSASTWLKQGDWNVSWLFSSWMNMTTVLAPAQSRGISPQFSSVEKSAEWGNSLGFKKSAYFTKKKLDCNVFQSEIFKHVKKHTQNALYPSTLLFSELCQIHNCLWLFVFFRLSALCDSKWI